MRRAVALFLFLVGALGAVGQANAARMPLDEKVRLATQVYQELFEVPDREVPRDLLKASKCIAIIPDVIKGAFGWGGRHGRGVLTCRSDEGWSAPIFVTLSGGSFGLQIGAQSTDIVLFIVNERSVRSLLKSKFTLGGDLSVAAGPVRTQRRAGNGCSTASRDLLVCEVSRPVCRNVGRGCAPGAGPEVDRQVLWRAPVA